MDRKELLSSKEYWLSKIQIDLFNHIYDYMENNNMNRTELAKKLGVSKGYISQILNGDSDHRISKIVEIALAIGLIPDLKYRNMEEFLLLDDSCKDRNEQELMDSLQKIHKEGYMSIKRKDDFDKRTNFDELIDLPINELAKNISA